MGFIKECKIILKSLIYIVFIGILILFYISQFGIQINSDINLYNNPNQEVTSELSRPSVNMDHYGYKYEEIPEKIMPNAIAYLSMEYMENEFKTYPIGFYKVIKLNEEELNYIDKLINSIMDKSLRDISVKAYEEIENSEAMFINNIDYSGVIEMNVDYEKFKEIMQEIDSILGGGSSYADLKSFGKVEKTYEESLEEYNILLNEDMISRAYARVFSDYMGIVIVLFSIFVSASYLLKDKLSGIEGLIYSRNISSIRLVVTRYLALVTMILIPIILLAIIPTVQLSIFGVENNLQIDHFAFLKYIFAWLVPSILFTNAVTYFLITILSSPIILLAQFLLNFISIMLSSGSIIGGNYGLNMLIRHNEIGNLELVQSNIDALIFNRLFYVLVSLIIIMITIILFNYKRKGGGIGFGIKKLIKNN